MKTFQKTTLALLMGSVALVGCGSDSKDDTTPPVTPPPENTPPVAEDASRVTESNLPLTINPMLHASDADEGDVLTLVSASSEQGKITVDGDRIRFDPQGEVGEVAIQYTISDGTDEASATITVKVHEAIYAGTQTCLTCHSMESLGDASAHQNHGHNFKIMKIANDEAPAFPYVDVDGALEMIDNDGNPTDNTLGTPVSYADVSYTSGGYAWKIRWMDEDGYLVTGQQAQHNVHAERLGYDDQIMSNYNGGTVDKPYDCGHCHTTGWKPYDEALNPQKQDDRPGIMGTWVAEGVQCEACHGAGRDHVKSMSKDDITRFATPRTTADLQSDTMGYGQPMHCAECHTRDGDRTHWKGYESSFNLAVAAALEAGEITQEVADAAPEYGARVMVRSGLPRHHQTHDELMAIDPDTFEITGKHYQKFPLYYGAENACAVCHDTHESTVFEGGATMACTDCHTGDHQKEFNDELSFSHASVDCVACHMPKVVKNALTTTTKAGVKAGDIALHTFAIDLYNEKGQVQDSEARDTYMYPYLQHDFACGQCHNADDGKLEVLKAKGGTIHK
ncbi:Cytochrome c554 and c-prime [Ferrimonas marina]|uniref:Cytochrome c554 and c-prime n=1 Tax=Ferrimonas marina TaxID=299255 RepID=A0A1M5X334_9GAMM|nr:Ig-like domain-containing protein [Ferrimonas marina]SHH93968.1 Cytochrome c554 and c-prime [Ferrimonas marina]